MNNNTTTHESRAAEIARTITTSIVATRLQRQGDIMMRRVGDPIDAPHEPTPTGGILIRAGHHGEHRLIGPELARMDGEDRISITAPALLVHTDVPEARHDPVQLMPGTWEYWALRELTLDGVVAEVED